MRLIIRVLGIASLIVASQSSEALVIDDFTEAPLTLVGAGDLLSQTGLDPSRVAGGVRTIEVSRAPDVFTLAIEDGSLSVANPDPADDWGYFQLMYGYEMPLDLDFTAEGHDRLRLRFGEVDPSGLDPMWISVNTGLPPRSNAPGPEYYSMPSNGGVFEIPFTAYPEVDFTDVNTFAIQVVRMRSTVGFTLEEVVTAGPPLVGDYDRNGVVDESDLASWDDFYGRRSNAFRGTLLGADGNGDFRVDAADYTVWRDAFDSSSESNSTIPEPAAVSLLLLLVITCPTLGIRPKKNL